MFEIIGMLHPKPLDQETTFASLKALLCRYTSESQLIALREAMNGDLPGEIVCGRWRNELGPDEGRKFNGGRRVDQALAELERLGYHPAPPIASVLSELQGLIPQDRRHRHVCLQKIFDELPDPHRMAPAAAALQGLLNGLFGKGHYSCLYFDAPVHGSGRIASFFARETLMELVSGAIVLVVPANPSN